MIFFGHLGLTTGAVKLYEKCIPSKKDNIDKGYIDYRFVLVGAILPDLIDKPIGAILFRSTFHNSRIFCHSLIVSEILILIGLYFWFKEKNNKSLLLGTASLIHLVFDSMWKYPTILFWPFTGWRLPQRPEGDWALSTMDKLLHDPSTYAPEILGFIILTFFFIKLVRNRKIKEFIKTGRL